MTHVLLFCTAEEAKPVSLFSPETPGNYHKTDRLFQFVWEVMSARAPGQKADDPGAFYLVESNVLPADRSGYKTSLQKGETFESDFIGASLEDCQKWALEKQYQVNFIEDDIIVVVDARSAQDKTVWVSHYEPNNDLSPWVFAGFGALPREFDTWYNYRVEFSYAHYFPVAFNYSIPEVVYPAFFGRKEDFTDEQGVFDFAAAQRFSQEYNPEDYWIDSPKL